MIIIICRDNFIILQGLIAALICYMFPSLRNWETLWDTKGLIGAIILHMTVSEPLYYFMHKLFHRQPYLFKSYHSLHHSSNVLQPFTAGNATFMEHLVMLPIVGIPLMGGSMIGHGSVSMVYVYILGFDFLRCMGHCNVEIIPHRIFDAVPLFRYLLYTPT
ncbi:hypothetical protein KSS87_012938 [Heliosperma pusillum]|nr:hypothetical protein KSS87_012938 [Heliosperma pusillum]